MVNVRELLVPIGVRRKGKALNFKGVTIHNVDNESDGANADANARYQASSPDYTTKTGGTSSWHYTVDEKEIVRSIPENEVAYHCGKNEGNNTTVSIEICDNADGDILKATDNAAELAADILKRHGHVSAVSGQNLFQHHDWSGKNCPSKLRAGKPYSWATFVEKVNDFMGAAQPSAPAQSTYTKKSFTLDHVVKKGSKEAVVGSIQNNLKAIGYDIGTAGPNGDGIDNNFGTKTDAAVRDVQKNGGVTVDGQVGKNTTPLLGGTWAEKSAPAASIPTLTRNLKLTSPMMRGDDVRQAQERLEKHLAQPGKIDGVFGNSTKEAVIRFQQARKNEGRDIGEVDGVIGPKTWAILWEPAPGE